MKSTIQAGTYTVYFEEKSFSALTDFLGKGSFSSIFILTDRNVKKHCLPILLKNAPALQKAKLITIKPGEQFKNIETAMTVWDSLTVLGADRHSLLINLGGGVVTDLGGFCASVFKRGISFVNIPTSSLAMADASVGAKTGIDYRGIKNHIGTFSDPSAVFIYPAFCKTLDQREYINGLAEVLKAAFISDHSLLALLNVKSKRHELFYRAIEIKNTIVKKDPKEKGLRKILNFGHTIGHAVESYFLGKKGKTVLHGEAIACGMIGESYIAYRLGLEKQTDHDFIRINCDKLFKRLELNEKQLVSIIALMKQDKKNKSGSIKLALVERPAVYHTEVDCSAQLIREALLYYIKGQ